MDSAELLFTDAKKSIDKNLTELGSAFDKITDSVVDSLTELKDTFNVYQLCPRRFNDWLTEATDKLGMPQEIGLFTQLQNAFNDGIMRKF